MRMIIYIIIGIVIIGGLTFYMIRCKNNSIVNPSARTAVPSDGAASIQFIDLLFAEQTIKEVYKPNNEDATNQVSVWGKFQLVEKLIDDNKKAEAKNILKEIASDKDSESRIVLWAWNGLRELGENPASTKVLGLILEVPIEGTTEYLAMFADGSARYIYYTGSIGIWDTNTDEMDKLIGNIMIKSQNYVDKQKLNIGRNKIPTDKVRFSFLTTSGIFQTENSFDELSGQQSDIGDIFNTALQALTLIVKKLAN